MIQLTIETTCDRPDCDAAVIVACPVRDEMDVDQFRIDQLLALRIAQGSGWTGYLHDGTLRCPEHTAN